jgi:hypothetical protein
MKVVLSCWDNPAGCAASLAGGVIAPVVQLPLLGSARGGHAWFDFCAGDGTATHPAQPDNAMLPPDPRSLIQAGVNAGKAVYFNAFWKDCHTNPALVGEPVAAKTCGDLRQIAARGQTLILGNGVSGAGAVFSGDGATGSTLFAPVSASSYNNLWQSWGLPGRPDNFDQLVAERYGMGTGTARNPYPLPGEDPNKTGGGSGQLPTALTQLRNADGSYTGTFNYTCHACHSGQVGTAADGPGLGALYGNSNSLSEFGLLTQDIGGLPPAIFGKTRGTNNALALQIIVFALSEDIRPADPNFIGFAALTPNGGSLDAPAWWNMGHRPVKFQDAFLSMDALRSDLGFFLPGPGPGGYGWIETHDRDADTYIMSLKSPAWPYGYCSNADGSPAAGDSAACINTPLAQQGAVLFHGKNLWAASLNNPTPMPDGGNGSCAGCHGAYSPRYVNDPTYLDSPALEGIASYVVPTGVIGTDPQRVDSDSLAAEEYGKGNFFAYPETVGQNPDCSTQNRPEVNGNRKPGYLAPPLYGIWATAPYFHNGSVPTVWEVLKPSDRQPIWRRVSTPARADQAGAVVMGYDTNLARSYDVNKLGWKYDTVSCGSAGATSYVDCNPGDQTTDPTFQQILLLLSGSNPFTWYGGVPPLTNQQLEDRKIYNTYMYGQGNQGHDFTSVLTDPERAAIIEYLKTL